MNALLGERAIWVTTVIVVAGTGLILRPAHERAPSLAPTVPPASAEPHQLNPDSLARATAFLVANDPFRLSHQPATVAYSPALEGVAPPPVARPPRPNLVLRGIVGGPPWSAIVDGVPGRDGSTLLRRGDSVASYVIRAVGRDTVTLKGADTTWQLTVKRP